MRGSRGWQRSDHIHEPRPAIHHTGALFDPGAHIGVCVQRSGFGGREPAGGGVFGPCQLYGGHIVLHDPDPVGTLAESEGIPHDVVVLADDVSGLLLRFAHGGAQRGSAVGLFGMALGKAPDSRCATEQKEDPRLLDLFLALALALGHKDNTGTNIFLRLCRHLIFIRMFLLSGNRVPDPVHFFRGLGFGLGFGCPVPQKPPL